MTTARSVYETPSLLRSFRSQTPRLGRQRPGTAQLLLSQNPSAMATSGQGGKASSESHAPVPRFFALHFGQVLMEQARGSGGEVSGKRLARGQAQGPFSHHKRHCAWPFRRLMPSFDDAFRRTSLSRVQKMCPVRPMYSGVNSGLASCISTKWICERQYMSTSTTYEGTNEAHPARPSSNRAMQCVSSMDQR